MTTLRIVTDEANETNEASEANDNPGIVEFARIPLCQIVGRQPRHDSEQITALRGSLDHLPLLHPLVVVREHSGYAIVCGAGRLAALRAKGEQEAWCAVLPYRPSSPEAQLALLDENLVRVELTNAEHDTMIVARRALIERLEPESTAQARLRAGARLGAKRGGRRTHRDPEGDGPPGESLPCARRAQGNSSSHPDDTRDPRADEGEAGVDHRFGHPGAGGARWTHPDPEGDGPPGESLPCARRAQGNSSSHPDDTRDARADEGEARSGGHQEVDPVQSSATSVAKAVGISKRAVQEATRRSEQAAPSVWDAYSRDELTKKQVDELARLAHEDQEWLLPQVVGLTQSETRLFVGAAVRLRKPDEETEKDLVAALKRIGIQTERLDLEVEMARSVIHRLPHLPLLGFNPRALFLQVDTLQETLRAFSDYLHQRADDELNRPPHAEAEDQA